MRRTMIKRWRNFYNIRTPDRRVSRSVNVKFGSTYTMFKPARRLSTLFSSRMFHPPASGVPADGTRIVSNTNRTNKCHTDFQAQIQDLTIMSNVQTENHGNYLGHLYQCYKLTETS